jgi:(2Fe-2S) ferredoxin
MAPFTRHVFVCTNVRPPGSPRGCCAEKGSEELVSRLKKAVKARGLHVDLRINKAGCLDTCEAGPSIVVYPEATWYGPVGPDDVDEIVEQHLGGGKPVERLKMKFPLPAPKKGD